MAVTGLGLVGFVITHLVGNFNLLALVPGPINQYTQSLANYGWLLEVAEVGLALMFLVHIWASVSLSLESKRARPVGYAVERTKGGPSKSTLSSRNMGLLGAFLAAFLVFHILQFKLGAGVQQGYVDTSNPDRPIRDMYRLVAETFQNPWYVALYCACMLVLGFHLRHGIWSAFQSMGVTHQGFSSHVYKASLVLAILLAGGFFIIPIYMYVGGTP